jgi:membrane-bound lytic murein transglycosylase A
MAVSESIRSAAIGAALILLASCAPRLIPPSPQPPPAQPTPPVPIPTPPTPPPVEPPPPANALAAGVRAGPEFATLGLAGDSAARALDAFLISCPAIVRREDPSSLTRPEDWQAVCAAAAVHPRADAASFFAARFETAIAGDGAAFTTGYYEPEIRGSRVRGPGYEVPVYARPADLLETNPLTGERARGRLDESGRFVPYYERAEIEDGALAGRGLEIAWAAEPVDLFFLQIQGSGRLLLPNGGVMRIGYDNQNGRDYVAIGRLLRDRGLVQPPVTMQRIVEWIRANPEAGRALMRENKSYVFFRELTGPGPLGALNRPVTARVSVAADPRFVPLGAPVVLSAMSNPLADGFWVAQDTGGAIRGANRFDTFWGAGAEAATIAGGMQGRGRALILLPRGSLARIAANVSPPQR